MRTLVQGSRIPLGDYSLTHTAREDNPCLYGSGSQLGFTHSPFPWDIWKYFWLSHLEVRMLLASRGQKPSVLLNVLQYAEQPHEKELSSPSF